MPRQPLNDLAAFAAVAQERSFTRAAKQLDVSSSALSHALRGLEARLGVRLLARTTRSVAPTEAGERLLATLRPALAEIDAGIAALHETRDKPVGTIRITAVKHAVETLLMPMLPSFTARYPGIRLEIDAEDGFSDIVADGYDAGIRFAGSVELDMIAVPIGPQLRPAFVASPAYLKDRGVPTSPRDLVDHRCIVHRGRDGVAYPWTFYENGKNRQFRLDGAIVVNDSDLMLAAAVAGQGIASVFADRAAPLISKRKLVSLMEAFIQPMQGYALYYAGRRQNPPALACFIAAIRHFDGNSASAHPSDKRPPAAKRTRRLAN